MRKYAKNIGAIVFIILVINIIGSYFFFRIDLTQDKRYTLSDISLKIIKNIEEPIYIDVYLTGELPATFQRLQAETRQIIEEYQAYNSNIIFRFIEQSSDKEMAFIASKNLFKKGLTPINITVAEKGKQSQLMVFPWATENYKGREVNIALLKNLMGATTEDKILGSVQNLEYAFSEAFKKLLTERQKKVAVIKGNGQLQDVQIAKFLLQVRENYHIGPFTLDSVETDALGTLKALMKYDLAIIAKPTEPFSDKEKQVLDQFIVNGGKTIWLIDQVDAELDNLYNPEGSTMAFGRDLRLNDMFFKYGIRILPALIKDEQGTPIKLASGAAGSATQFQEFNWKFAPFIVPVGTHATIKNLGGIKFDFANPIEILKNDIQKTILLQSSPYSKAIGVPSIISLNIVNETEDLKQYQGSGNLPVAVLLEGKFHSVFENRVLGFKDINFVSTDKKSQIIVIADGDLIKNNIDKNGIPLELGYDQKTGNLFDNKDFIINCVNYLLDDSGLINIRAKDITLPLLDKEKVSNSYVFTQLIAVVLPLIILILFAFLFTMYRRKKYNR